MMKVCSWVFTVSNIRKLWWKCGPEDLLFEISGNGDEYVVLRIYCLKYQEMMMRCGPEDLLLQISGNDDEYVVLRTYCFWCRDIMMKVWSWGFTLSDIRKWWWIYGPDILLFQTPGNGDGVWYWGFTVSVIRKWWWRCGPENLMFQISGNYDEVVVLRIYCYW